MWHADENTNSVRKIKLVSYNAQCDLMRITKGRSCPVSNAYGVLEGGPSSRRTRHNVSPTLLADWLQEDCSPNDMFHEWRGAICWTSGNRLYPESFSRRYCIILSCTRNLKTKKIMKLGLRMPRLDEQDAPWQYFAPFWVVVDLQSLHFDPYGCSARVSKVREMSSG